MQIMRNLNSQEAFKDNDIKEEYEINKVFKLLSIMKLSFMMWDKHEWWIINNLGIDSLDIEYRAYVLTLKDSNDGCC